MDSVRIKLIMLLVLGEKLTASRYRLRALVAKREWNEIEEISKTKKSPIGWEVRIATPALARYIRQHVLIGGR